MHNFNNMNEAEFEHYFLENLKNLGYKFISSEEIDRLRNNRIDIFVLEKILFDKLIQVNPGKEEFVPKAVKKIIDLVNNNSELMDKNFKGFQYLTQGIQIEVSKGKVIEYIHINVIDFDNLKNNDFIVTNQVHFFSLNPGVDSKRQIPDVLVFINGIPVIVCELKTPKKLGDDLIKGAYNQIEGYWKYINSLFTYNVFNFISNFYFSKVGALNSGFEFFSVWKNMNDKKEKTKDMFEEKFLNTINSLFSKNVILDLLKNFTIFTNGIKKEKIIASFHQFYATKNVFEKLVQNDLSNISSVNNKAGTIWHTQGTGKSFLIVFLIKNLANYFKKMSFVVVVDRIDLAEQIKNVLDKSDKYYLNQNIFLIESIEDLNYKLKDIKQNGVFVTTIQKFRDLKHDFLSDRKDILIIADEAHRSHNQDVRTIYDFKKDIFYEKLSNSQILKKSFPNAKFLGLTGTPLLDYEKDTRKIFGDYVSIYQMNEATEDGFVVPINYQGVNLGTTLNEEVLDELDEKYEEAKKEIKNSLDGQATELAQSILSNKTLSNLKFLESNERANTVIDNFIKHYSERKDILKGKAMFVCFSREMAFKYYKLVLEKKPEWENVVKLIITGNKNDENIKLKDLVINKKEQKTIIENFKKPDSEVKIIFVVDMLLTGYDVPSLDLMYIDKPLKNQNLMQAITRVNRRFEDESKIKNSALIVDYIGILPNIAEALKKYTNDTIENIDNAMQYSDISNLKNLFDQMMNEIYQKYFKNIQINNDNLYETALEMFECLNYVKEQDVQNSFIDELILEYKNIIKIYPAIVNIVNTRDKNKVFLLKMVVQIITRDVFEKFDFTSKSKELKETAKNAFIFEKKEVYNDSQKVVTFDQLMNVVNDIKENEKFKNYAASQANELIQKAISLNSNIIEKEKKRLSERLKEILIKYQTQQITYEEFIREIKAFVIEVNNKEKQQFIPGFSPEMNLIFQTIRSEEFTNGKFTNEQIEKIVREIFIEIKEHINERWFEFEAKRTMIGGKIKRILLRNNFPPKEAVKSVDDIKKELDKIINSRKGLYSEQ
ncbi:type I restriction endonuclease subunit R [Candidatus Mycoplasma pogonae]